MNLLERLAALKNRLTVTEEPQQTRIFTARVSSTAETLDEIPCSPYTPTEKRILPVQHTAPRFTSTILTQTESDVLQASQGNSPLLLNPYRGICDYAHCQELVDPRNDGFYFVAIYQAMKRDFLNTQDIASCALVGQNTMRRIAQLGPKFSREYSQKRIHKHMYPVEGQCKGSSSLQRLFEGEKPTRATAMTAQELLLYRCTYEVMQSVEIHIL